MVITQLTSDHSQLYQKKQQQRQTLATQTSVSIFAAVSPTNQLVSNEQMVFM